MPIMAYVIYIYIVSSRFTLKHLINALFWIGIANLAAIAIEVNYPPANIAIANFMNVPRMQIVERFSFRVLGLASSYEFTSIVNCVFMVVCSMKYKYKPHILYLILMIVSFLSLIFVSRTGMLLGGVTLLILLFNLLYVAKGFHKVFVVTSLYTAGAIALLYVIPILVNTSGLFDTKMELDSNLQSNMSSEFSSGSAGQLTGGSHLNILNRDFLDILVGYGVQTEDYKYARISTDIGYLEFIGQIGIIGLAMVLFLHIKLIHNIHKWNKYFHSKSYKLLGSMIIGYIIIILALNYKLQLLYSRGAFEFMIILVSFYAKFLNNEQKINKV
jgi:hypothetical protein